MHVHDQYQSFFPPDVHYVAGKGSSSIRYCAQAGFAQQQLCECGTDGGMRGMGDATCTYILPTAAPSWQPATCGSQAVAPAAQPKSPPLLSQAQTMPSAQ